MPTFADCSCFSGLHRQIRRRRQVAGSLQEALKIGRKHEGKWKPSKQALRPLPQTWASPVPRLRNERLDTGDSVELICEDLDSDAPNPLRMIPEAGEVLAQRPRLNSRFEVEQLLASPGSLPPPLPAEKRETIIRALAPTATFEMLARVPRPLLEEQSVEMQELRRKLTQGATLVFVSAGYPGKRFIFERAAAMGVKSVIVDHPDSWSRSLVQEGIVAKFLPVDMSQSSDEVYRQSESLIRQLGSDGVTGAADGITTFVELSVPLAARLCEAFGLPGYRPEAVDAARDKHRTRAALKAAGLPTPRNALIRNEAELEREPMFSLDPKIDASANKHKLWQVKRFEPAWLDGTSVGEVMFQADYHLKELSMGEHSQPVSGMRNCFDYSEEQGLDKEWSAREWFVVNKAEIQISKDNVIFPRVEMGVEARETFKGEKGLEDVPITRPDHPLVQYADAFTHNFELIAERKSVVHQLRELAKASVLAKFLVENQACLGEEWFTLADTSAGPSAHREIPQLWNEQRVSQIQVEDGRIVSSAEGVQCASMMHGVYGGVEMGLDQMQRVAVGRVPTAKVSVARAPALSQRLIQARTGLAEMPLEVPGAPPGVPKGVDLNLDKFDLDTAAEAEPLAPEGSWGGEEFIGRAFWKNLSGSAFKEEDRTMLRELFDSHLCDRREECELFVPPDTSLAHVQKLRMLLKEEAAVRQQRKNHFLSMEFEPEGSSILFPGWKPSLTIAGALAGAFAPRSQLHARPEYISQAASMVKHTVAGFNRSTEDGTHFRIYQLGSLQVRTIQEPGKEETVGAVFSSQELSTGPTAPQGNWSAVAKTDKIVKATLYVEQNAAAEGEQRQHFFTLLETDQSDNVTVETLPNGSLTWAESSVGLEARKAQAKVLRAAECRDGRMTVDELRARLGEAASIEAVLLLVLPAREKAWAALNQRELSSAKQLGIMSAQDWDERVSDVFGLDWVGLSKEQRAAAEDLGFDSFSWRPSAAKNEQAIRTWDKPWAELSAAECLAAKKLGLTGKGDWETKSAWEVLRREAGGIWEMSWAQLSEDVRAAAITLGISDADCWDEASWEPNGAWERLWVQLKQEERQAAEELGISSSAIWDVAFGGKERKGQGLVGIWEKSWAQLDQNERLAAKNLGISGAGAWDKSKAKSSAEKTLAKMTKAEQEAMMEAWFMHKYSIGSEN